MDFVQLWDFVQSLSPRMQEEIFSADDVVLLDEMVVAQNFSIALDLLCHRMRDYQARDYPGREHRRFPEEIRDLLHSRQRQEKRQKFIDVTPPPLEATPTLEEFRAVNLIGLPPPPLQTATPLSPPSANRSAAATPHAESNVEQGLRRKLMEEQDLAYLSSLIEDTSPMHDWEDEDDVVIEESTPPEIENVPSAQTDEQSGVSVQIILPDRRLQARMNPTITRLKNLRRWIYDQTDGDDYDQFFTNYPKREWSQDQLLCELPIEKQRLLLIAQQSQNE